MLYKKSKTRIHSNIIIIKYNILKVFGHCFKIASRARDFPPATDSKTNRK